MSDNIADLIVTDHVTAAAISHLLKRLRILHYVDVVSVEESVVRVHEEDRDTCWKLMSDHMEDINTLRQRVVRETEARTRDSQRQSETRSTAPYVSEPSSGGLLSAKLTRFFFFVIAIFAPMLYAIDTAMFAQKSQLLDIIFGTNGLVSAGVSVVLIGLWFYTEKSHRART